MHIDLVYVNISNRRIVHLHICEELNLRLQAQRSLQSFVRRAKRRDSYANIAECGMSYKLYLRRASRHKLSGDASETI